MPAPAASKLKYAQSLTYRYMWICQFFLPAETPRESLVRCRPMSATMREESNTITRPEFALVSIISWRRYRSSFITHRAIHCTRCSTHCGRVAIDQRDAVAGGVGAAAAPGGVVVVQVQRKPSTMPNAQLKVIFISRTHCRTHFHSAKHSPM
jgi:hypothetical protein